MRCIVVHGDEVDEYKIPSGAEKFTSYLKNQFPDDADKIEKLMAYSVSMFSQVRKLKVNQTLTDKLATLFKAPKVISNLNQTYSGLMVILMNSRRLWPGYSRIGEGRYA